MSHVYCRRHSPRWFRRLYRAKQHVAVWFITALFIFGGWLLFTGQAKL